MRAGYTLIDLLVGIVLFSIAAYFFPVIETIWLWFAVIFFGLLLVNAAVVLTLSGQAKLRSRHKARKENSQD